MDPLAAALARFPLPLAQPWEVGWRSEIVFHLSDGPTLAFVADGEQVAVREVAAEAPFCTVRCDTSQLSRLLAGDSAILLTFEGLVVDELGDLMALQNVYRRAVAGAR